MQILAISGYGEWFWLMAKNIKPVENRNWSLFKYIKPEQLPLRLCLHVSKTPASPKEVKFIIDTLKDKYPNVLREFMCIDWQKMRGTIIGEMTCTGEVQSSDSVWFFGPYGFTCKDGLLYNRPIPYRGQLGIFPVEIDPMERISTIAVPTCRATGKAMALLDCIDCKNVCDVFLQNKVVRHRPGMVSGK